MRRATVAVVAMLRPSATANTSVRSDSVTPTVAVAVLASAPRCETQKTLMMPNSDSIAISSIIGTASMKIARPIEPSVKSCREPRIASRRNAAHLGKPGKVVLDSIMTCYSLFLEKRQSEHALALMARRAIDSRSGPGTIRLDLADLHRRN